VAVDDDPTYNDVIDCLSEREGKQVYVEIGLHDPTQDSTDIIVAMQHEVTLGKPQIGENLDHEGRGVTYLPFAGHERNRFFIDPAHISAIRRGGPGFKIWFHDSTYIGFVD
jgi:hypothetical protein